MSSAQWAVSLSAPAWERSVKHSLSFLAEFKSSPCSLIFTSVETEDQPWWSQCFCHLLLGWSWWLLEDFVECKPCLRVSPSLRKGAEVTFSAASPLLPRNSQGERDICADLVGESLNPKQRYLKDKCGRFGNRGVICSSQTIIGYESFTRRIMRHRRVRYWIKNYSLDLYPFPFSPLIKLHGIFLDRRSLCC